MARRRDVPRPGRPRPPVPEWLSGCVLADWVDPADLPPPDWAFGAAVWRQVCAHERWREAGRAWLAAYGYPGGWYRYAWPGDWAVDPHRLAKEADRGAA